MSIRSVNIHTQDEGGGGSSYRDPRYVIKGKKNLVATIHITGGNASFSICEASSQNSNESEWKRVDFSQTAQTDDSSSKKDRTIILTYNKGDTNKWYWLREEQGITTADYTVNGNWVIG
ncbi:hypothetical protein N0Y54_37130 [Nostoc punctiforme UO1]|uniref:hypothetical protein n=1 Tax=Nostoc punctiforme TaxID=272131 RepID=UPI0030AEDA15